MTQGNGTTAEVELLVGDVEGILAVDTHGGKGLVDLNDVDVVDGEVVLAQELGDGGGWANTHNTGRNTGNRSTDELGQDGLSQLDGS